MRHDEIQAILEITAKAWGNCTMHKLLEDRHGMIGAKGWQERKVNELRDFCERKPDNVLVAERNGSIAGYATFDINAEDSVGRVLNNAVAPECRGGGIGSLMNRAILDIFRSGGVRVAVVSTMGHDKAAQHVYEKQGFKEIARSVHYSMELS